MREPSGNGHNQEEINRQSQEKRALKDRPSRARYNKVHANLERRWRRRELKPERMMREVVDELWDQFGGSPYSWCGFYLWGPSRQELVLGPHRDKPACSPLPLHGVCGEVAQSGECVIVADVKALGGAYIECDPKNVSEIVVPVFDHKGKIWAVFDVNSDQAGAFDDMDQRWLDRILKNFQEVDKPE